LPVESKIEVPTLPPMPVPLPRWGVRFTADVTHNQQYVQGLYNNNASAAKRGELFLNEPAQSLYYVGADGIARTVNGTTSVAFSRIDFTGLRNFVDDAAAAAATPAVPVGGMYRTGSVLKVRVV
jgi:hypothetical protein